MTITAKEIAERLGISAATVSMVLNHKPGISDTTRAQVLEEAKRSGYDFSKHSIPASGVIYFLIYKKHGKVVGDTPFFSQVIEGLESECRHYGYNLQLLYYNEWSGSDKQLDPIINSGCSGVIVLGTEMLFSDYELFSRIPVPIVVLDSYYDELPYSTVLINNTRGSFLATSLLVQNGHTDIGYLQSSRYISNFEERADGFYRALRKNKISKKPQFVFRVTPVMESARQEFSDILDTHPALPTCFFADNDIIAIGCMQALKAHGYRIPEDISVVGFDDIPACQYLDPPLTTVLVPKQMLGAFAVKQLMEQIANPTHESTKIAVTTHVVVRGSVKNRNA